jgi:hypothetical protein
MTSYLSELRSEWRPLAAAVIGLSGGLVIISYVMGIMGPYLIQEFGWAKSDLALVGALALGAVLVFPFVGRLTDVYGVRATASIGVIACPLLFLALTAVGDLAATRSSTPCRRRCSRARRRRSIAGSSCNISSEPGDWRLASPPPGQR